MDLTKTNTSFVGPAICGLLILLWWLFFSRATLKEKLLGFFSLMAFRLVAPFLASKSLGTEFGMTVYVVPWAFTAFGVTLVLARQMHARTRLALLAALVAFGCSSLVRIEGLSGDFQSSLVWRWKPSAEQRFLETCSSRPAALRDDKRPAAQEPLATPEWPAFRGPHRDSVQPGVVLEEDWNSHPPQEAWRVRVGPGWSSFAVAGDRLFTQEQRGEHEAVVCYHAQTGSQRWVRLYKSRFWEPIAGAGPQATPALSDGKLFAAGAEGIVHALDPITGHVIWRRDVRVDAGREPPQWGYASSPLVVGKHVIVYAGGPGDRGVLAYDCETGELRWGAPAGDHTYSSPHLATIAGKTCVLMLTNDGLAMINPADGALLGQYDWQNPRYRMVQPLLLDGSSILLGTGMGAGARRIDVQLHDHRFVTKQRWASPRISPYFSDYVAHQGHLYGFDHNIFACIELQAGARMWKGGRYGHGQALLLPDGDQLLVITEKGELVLLRANPRSLEELARWQALDGKTWNHPVLVGDRLYVRNGEEAACFEMTLRRGALIAATGTTPNQPPLAASDHP